MLMHIVRLNIDYGIQLHDPFWSSFCYKARSGMSTNIVQQVHRATEKPIMELVQGQVGYEIGHELAGYVYYEQS